MKFGHILVCCMTDISNMFLGQCWRTETISRSLYDFIKITIFIGGCFLIKKSVGCTIDTFVPLHKSKVSEGRKHSMYFTTFDSVKLNFLRTVHIL